MTMFKRKPPLVRIGESFVKAGDPSGIAWRVTRVWTTAIGIPHAQIENSCLRKETRIISISALTDMHFFRSGVPVRKTSVIEENIDV